MGNSHISSSSVVGVNVTFGRACEIGEYVVIEDGARLGDECRVGHHAVIHRDSVIGDRVRIDPYAILGKARMRARRSVLQPADDLPPAVIGDDCIIGSHVAIYRGAEIAGSVLVADQATVREGVSIGENTIVGRNVTVENQTIVGRKCKLETNCYITAYSVIEDFCFIAPMVSTSNDRFIGRTEERLSQFKGIVVKRGGRIGVGATILPGIVIGEDALVGAGSVVTHDVPAKAVVTGVPARWFGTVPSEQLLENQGWDGI
jgi:UDP-2-acetamido-3-amino-2,3-dideoxy-glucuronate N-acetyltransferase